MAVRTVAIALALLLSAVTPLGAQEGPSYAELGVCRLESGAEIRPCRLAYRTVGRLDPDGSNAVLFPTWYGGTAGSMLSFVGPGKLVDTDRYFVVLTGVFGDGESTSPSNHVDGAEAFPAYGLRDLVRAQHRLLTETLGIRQLHAVVGMSMGGMQALEWAFTFPGFSRRVAAVVATPRLGSWDAMFWETELRLIEACLPVACGDLGGIIYMLEYLVGSTPERWLVATPRDSLPGMRAAVDAEAAAFDGADIATQIRALLGHDVARPFGGSLEAAVASNRSEMLLVVNPQDHMVTPAATRELGRLAGVPVVEIGGDCGHYVWTCELAALGEVVRGFLDDSPSPRGGPVPGRAARPGRS